MEPPISWLPSSIVDINRQSCGSQVIISHTATTTRSLCNRLSCGSHASLHITHNKQPHGGRDCKPPLTWRPQSWSIKEYPYFWYFLTLNFTFGICFLWIGLYLIEWSIFFLFSNRLTKFDREKRKISKISTKSRERDNDLPFLPFLLGYCHGLLGSCGWQGFIRCSIHSSIGVW